MRFTLKIWRQENANAKGRFETYTVDEISPDCSFLEMLDILNSHLIADKIAHPVCFDNDCREGICGMCGLYINGRPHGNDDGVTTCQLHMRRFTDGDTIWIEPWRAKAFPVIRDLVVDRTAFDKIIQAGGYISATTGGVPDANSILIPKDKVDKAMDAAECIGCGACVAACKNASAMLFVGAKVSHLALLPQGRVEAADRVQKMVKAMDELGFGNCSNTYACEAECPKQIKRTNIARMNREWIAARVGKEKKQ
ncbi:MAG: succinate dehydrogenase/fumarate reductase iron-sulfur subunit [Bacteroidales bacterium]|nr:succinate dehydrogenase/fumarate reductase iron-sulfur subunit [Bacteroidales bacterium]